MITNEKGFICIDPGIQTGLVLFSPEMKLPYYTNVFECKINITWEEKRWIVVDLIGQFFAYIREKSGTMGKFYECPVYIEKPTFESSNRGLAAARSENLYKLIWMFAGISNIIYAMGHPLKEVSVSSWKGQLSKQQVISRINKILGQKYSNHIADAVGIGLYIKGDF